MTKQFRSKSHLILAKYVLICILAPSLCLAWPFKKTHRFEANDCLFRSTKLTSIDVYFKVIGVDDKQYVAKPLFVDTSTTQRYAEWGQPIKYDFDFLDDDIRLDKSKSPIKGSASTKILCSEVPDLDKFRKDHPGMLP